MAVLVDAVVLVVVALVVVDVDLDVVEVELVVVEVELVVVEVELVVAVVVVFVKWVATFTDIDAERACENRATAGAAATPVAANVAIITFARFILPVVVVISRSAPTISDERTWLRFTETEFRRRMSQSGGSWC